MTTKEPYSNARVAIVSPFRNSDADLPSYIARATDLDWPRDQLRWHLVEGDSTDDTWVTLYAWQSSDPRIHLHKCDTGKPHYGSQVDPERFQILAQVFNTGLSAATADDWADYICFIPSDVYYEPSLIKRLIAWDKDIIAPMFWISNGAGGYRFYDVWGFAEPGKAWPPGGFEWYETHLPREPILMDTIGGAKLIKRAVLDAGCRYTRAEVDHGLCKMARAAGFKVWADPTTHILHGRERFPIKV